MSISGISCLTKAPTAEVTRDFAMAFKLNWRFLYHKLAEGEPLQMLPFQNNSYLNTKI